MRVSCLFGVLQSIIAAPLRMSHEGDLLTTSKGNLVQKLRESIRGTESCLTCSACKGPILLATHALFSVKTGV
jgi:hypothetical protein